MKCNQSRLGFELVSPWPFPTTVTITPRALLYELVSLWTFQPTLVYENEFNNRFKQRYGLYYWWYKFFRIYILSILFFFCLFQDVRSFLVTDFPFLLVFLCLVCFLFLSIFSSSKKSSVFLHLPFLFGFFFLFLYVYSDSFTSLVRFLTNKTINSIFRFYSRSVFEAITSINPVLI